LNVLFVRDNQLDYVDNKTFEGLTNLTITDFKYS